MNEKMKKVRDKIEDSIVKVYGWTQKHPVLTTIGTTVLGSVVTGVVMYKKGYHDSSVDAGKWIQGDPCEISLHCDENSIYGPKDGSLYEAHDLTDEPLGTPRSNILLGALLMKLQNGDGAVVWKSAEDHLEVYAVEEPDIMMLLCEDALDTINNGAPID